jgi:hypothetical protein
VIDRRGLPVLGRQPHRERDEHHARDGVDRPSNRSAPQQIADLVDRSWLHGQTGKPFLGSSKQSTRDDAQE